MENKSFLPLNCSVPAEAKTRGMRVKEVGEGVAFCPWRGAEIEIQYHGENAVLCLNFTCVDREERPFSVLLARQSSDKERAK